MMRRTRFGQMLGRRFDREAAFPTHAFRCAQDAVERNLAWIGGCAKR